MSEEWEEGVRQINECQYLFVESIRESEELTLELVVTQAKLQAPTPIAMDGCEVAELLADSRPIEKDLSCHVFRLVFDRKHMVSYTVLDECFGIYPTDPEKFSGKLFRVFSWSHLLEFTKRTTNASDDYPGVLQHYQVACLNHVIDVICTGPPKIVVVYGVAGSVQ